MDYARNVAPFRVVRKPVSPKLCEEINVSAGYNYHILHPDGRVGDMQLIFASIDQYEDIGLCSLSTQFEQLGFDPRDTLSHLNEFYPNGRNLDEYTSDHMRTGVGSTMFNTAIQDAKDYGAKGMVVISGRPSMRSFVKKKGLEKADARGFKWYVLFGR
jgi:hypothetical protein